MLLRTAGVQVNLITLLPCGSREEARDTFRLRLSNKSVFTAMLIDSEDPVDDRDRCWDHLKIRDNWDKPSDTTDEQVLLMTTCMESWVIADMEALKSHYRHHLQASALPSTHDLEQKPRDQVQAKLEHATRNCPAPYKKGTRSFEVLAKLNPETLTKRLPSFARTIRILKEKIK